MWHVYGSQTESPFNDAVEEFMEGKSVKEIAALLQIGEDGVRYHNKNIHATLGAKGLEQLRLFISIMKQEEQASKGKELK